MQETTFPVEILIHDDASTDNTANIIREYEIKYPQLFKPIYQTENQFSRGLKPSITFNYPRAKGKYIALCEGDDYWLSREKLQKQVDALNSDPDMAVCFHNVKEIFDDPQVATYCYCPQDQKIISSIEDLFVRNFLPTCSVMFRSNIIKKIPSWFTKLSFGDWSLNLLNAQEGYIYYLNETLGVHRNHSSSSWSSKGLLWQCQEILKALSVYSQHFSYNPDYQQLIRECAARHSHMIVEEYRQKGDRANAEKYLAYADLFKAGYFPAKSDIAESKLTNENNNMQLSKFEELQNFKNRIMSQSYNVDNSLDTIVPQANIEPIFLVNSIKMPGFSFSIRTPVPGQRYLTAGDNSMLAASFVFDAPTGEVLIGDNTLIGGSVVNCINSIKIGNYVNIAWNCTICDHDLYPVDFNERQNDLERQFASLKAGQDILFCRDWSKITSEPIVICDNVWIGINCIILKGVTIGEGSIISAGSIVYEDVAPWSLVMGNPASQVG